MSDKSRNIFSLLFFLLIFPIAIFALAPQEPPILLSSTNEVLDLIVRIRDWIYTIFGIVAVIFIVLAAFDYLTSGGDPTKVKAAQSKLIYALVAIAIALFSGGIITTVSYFIKPLPSPDPFSPSPTPLSPVPVPAPIYLSPSPVAPTPPVFPPTFYP